MYSKQNKWLTSFLPIGALALFTLLIDAKAQTSSSTDCSSYIGPTKRLKDKVIGPQACTIYEETDIQSASDVPYQRVEMGISGTIDGYAVKSGLEMYQFADYPEFVLAQKGNLGPYFHGINNYSGEKGKSGMTLFLPKSAADWNGKLFVIFHGGSPFPPIGDLLPRKPGQYNPLMSKNEYAGLMIDKGYAVAYTRRSAYAGRAGDQQVILDDGTVLTERAHGYHVGLLRDWVPIAKNLIEARLGRKPTRTYWYGRSAGAAPGRLFNYVSGVNLDANGQRIFDGMILDDSAGGFFLPTLYFTRVDNKDGSFSVKPDYRDHLVFDEARKQMFVPQIDTLHQLYSGPRWVATIWGGDYPTIKRQNTRFLIEKGLGQKHRLYEIAGVSHGDAGAHYPSKQWEQNLDLAGMFDALIDVLDYWVERGVEPPPTRSDLPRFGDFNGDRVIENPAISLPEAACPCGVYFEFPGGIIGRSGEEGTGAGRTGFAAFLKEERPAINADTMKVPPGFDPSWLEPLDSRGRFVDMNGNNVRDTRESITQAWRRRGREGKQYGVLEPNEALTHGGYVTCVARVASELYEQRLITEAAMLHYIREAISSDIGKAPSK